MFCWSLLKATTQYCNTHEFIGWKGVNIQLSHSFVTFTLPCIQWGGGSISFFEGCVVSLTDVELADMVNSFVFTNHFGNTDFNIICLGE